MSKNIDKIVNRFLGWKLPKDFAPDGGISFKPSEHPDFWPVGTHLFTTDQAKAMFEYCLQGAEQAEQEPVAYVYEKDVAGIGMRKDVAFTKHVEVGTDLYAAPVSIHSESETDSSSSSMRTAVRTKDMTDIEDLQDAMTKALKKAFQLGQTYFQQADSESYAANKRADITLELYRKLEDNARAVIAADREKNRA